MGQSCVIRDWMTRPIATLGHNEKLQCAVFSSLQELLDSYLSVSAGIRSEANQSPLLDVH
jgi:hypothetical protein